MPSSISDKGNILLEILSCLELGKRNGKQNKLTYMSVVERLNVQYQNALKEWAQEAEQIKEELKADYETMQKSMSEKSWFAIIGCVVVGALAAIAVPGFGLAISAKLAFLAGAAATGTAVTAAAGIKTAANGEKFSSAFVDSEKVADPSKVQLMTNKVTEKQIEAQRKQTQASTKQAEIARKTETDLRSIQEAETTGSNLIVNLYSAYRSITNFMGRG